MIRAALCATLALLLLPAVAAAADYCVDSPADCPAGAATPPTLTAALGSAKASTAVADTIHLGSGTFTTSTGFEYDQQGEPDNDLRIIGSGREATILTTDTPTKQGSFIVLEMLGESGADTSVSDLSIVSPDRPDLPSGLGDAPVGLWLFRAAAERLTIRNPANATQGGGQTGAHLTADSRISDSTISLGTTGGVSGVRLAAASTVVEGVQITDAYWGIYADQSGAGRVSRARIAASAGVVACLRCDGVDVVNSILLPGGQGTGLLSWSLAEDAQIDASHVTIVGPLGAGSSRGVHALVDGAGSSTVRLDNSIIDGVAQTLVRSVSSGAGSASVTAVNSNYDASTKSGSGAGGFAEQVITNDPPGFVNAGGGDYHLGAGSAMIDKGRTSNQFVSAQVDIDSETRPIDAAGDAGAEPDLGADEYQARPPLAVLNAPDSLQEEQPSSFSGATSNAGGDPGDSIVSHVWDFGDGSVGNGAVLDHAFAEPGTYTVKLTVVDEDGKSASATKAVAVTAKPAPPPPPSTATPVATPTPRPVVDRTPPTLVADLKSSSFRRKRGTPLRVGLSEAAKLRIQFRRAGKTKRTYTRSLRKGTSTLNLKTQTRRLKAGGYTLVLTATDAAGNVSRRVSLKARLRP